MHISVRTLTGKEIRFDNNEFESSSKVLDVKGRVEEKEGIPAAQQRLIFSGKQMADDKTLEEYGVGEGAQLHLVLALRGGC